MRSVIALLTLICLMPGAGASAQKEGPITGSASVRVVGVVVREVVNLRYSDPADIALRLRVRKGAARTGVPTDGELPAGIEAIVPDPRTNSLRISGTPEAIAAIKKRIEALDVQPRLVRIQLNVLRFDFDADGNWDVHVVSSPTISTLDNFTATMSNQGDADAHTTDVTPHLNPDGSISLEGGLRARGQRVAFRRQIAPRTRAILAGVADVPSAAIRKTAESGLIPSAKGEAFTVYYLQLVSVQETTK